MKTGIAAHIASQLGGGKGNTGHFAIAETIENNVHGNDRKKRLQTCVFRRCQRYERIIAARKAKAVPTKST